MNVSLFDKHKICKYDIEKMFDYFFKLNYIWRNDLVLVPILHININLTF